MTYKNARVRSIGCIVLLLMSCCTVRAQHLLGLDNIYRILSDSFPIEKVYLHTDKDRYIAGDTLWFKAYLTAGGVPSGISTSVHVELLNPSGQVLQRKYYPVLKGGVSLGDLELKDSLRQGLYTIRAYTEWMTNSDPAFFYQYTFPLYAVNEAINSTASKTAKTHGAGAAATGSVPPVPPSEVAVQFLPEGGDAVDNVLTTVAFKATDEKGLPVKVTGRVVDDLDTLASNFQSFHDGMGLFDYIPFRGRTYTAIVETPMGERRIALPPSRPDGVVLNARLTPKGVSFILRSDSGSRYIGQPLQVMCSMYGQVVYKAKTRLPTDIPEVNGFIPTSSFTSGILTVTLFDGQGLPLAERILFIRPTPYRMDASLSLDTLRTEGKALNVWHLRIPDTVRSMLSLSITDADALTPGEDGPNILTGLLLSGDLKGHIYHPAWYFRNDADSTQAALDLVMRTQGWRRFDWAAMAQGHFPPSPNNDRNYLSFQGQAMTESGKKAVKNTYLNVFLRGSDSTKKFIFTPVDSTGHFILDGVAFNDTAVAYFQVNKKGYAATNVQLKLQPNPLFPFTEEDKTGVIFPGSNADSAFVGNGSREADMIAGLRRLQRAKELKEIIIKGRKADPLQEMDARYTGGLFAGGYSHSFDLVNDNKEASAYFDIMTFLQGRVPGLLISGSYPGITAKYRGGTPAFFVDEMTTDLDMLESIPVTDIAYVKVFPPPFMGAFGGGPYGAIAIYTRRGGDQTAAMEGLNRLTLTGYSSFRQYYAPVYNGMDTIAMDRPDFRITLDWAPYLFSGPDHPSLPIRFYNNDVCRHFRVVAEGIDENGNLLHFEKVVGADPVVVPPKQ